MATPKNFINSVVFAKPDFSQADGLPRFYPTIDLQGGNIENVVLINGELPITVPPTGGYVRYDACDGTIYDISVNLMNGSSNIQLGYQAGDYGKGSRNVMIGYFAANGTGTDLSDSVVIGTQSGVNSDGSNNVYIGPYSGYYTGGSNNVFIGAGAGYDMSGINNNNIFLGRNAGSFLTDVSDMLIVGDASDTLIRGHMKNHTVDICGDIQFVDGSFNRIQGVDISLNGHMSLLNPNYNLINIGTGTGTIPSYIYGPTLGVSGLNIGSNYFQDNLGNHFIGNVGRMTSRILMTGLNPPIQFFTGPEGQNPTNLGYTQDSSGNVGIGKTPTTNLDVAGIIQSNRIIATDASFTNLSVNNILYDANDISAVDISCSTIQASNRIGIGKYPSNTFDVSGNVVVTTGSGVYGIAHTDTSVNLSTYIGAGSGAWFGTTSKHPLNLYTNNSASPSIYIDTSGNVGIGKTSLQDALDISGNLRMNGTSGSAMSRIGTTGGNLYFQTMLTNGNIGNFTFTNVDVSGGQVAATIDGSGNATFNSSLKTNNISSTINGPFYTFKNSVSGFNINSTSVWMDVSQNVSFIDNIYSNSGNIIRSYTNNGVFTAPINGVYTLGFTVRMDAGSYPAGFRIYNRTRAQYYPESYGIWAPIGGSPNNRMCVTYTTNQYLTKNDVVYIQALTDNTGGSLIQYLEFCGNLLHSV